MGSCVVNEVPRTETSTTQMGAAASTSGAGRLVAHQVEAGSGWGPCALESPLDPGCSLLPALTSSSLECLPCLSRAPLSGKVMIICLHLGLQLAQTGGGLLLPLT